MGKYGDPSDLQVYKRGRDFASLKSFADDLGPACGPTHLERCSDEQKAKIEEYKKMGVEKRHKLIKEIEGKAKKAEKEYKDLQEGIEQVIIDENKRRDKEIEDIKASSGLP